MYWETKQTALEIHVSLKPHLRNSEVIRSKPLSMMQFPEIVLNSWATKFMKNWICIIFFQKYIILFCKCLLGMHKVVHSLTELFFTFNLIVELIFYSCMQKLNFAFCRRENAFWRFTFRVSCFITLELNLKYVYCWNEMLHLWMETHERESLLHFCDIFWQNFVLDLTCLVLPKAYILIHFLHVEYIVL